MLRGDARHQRLGAVAAGDPERYVALMAGLALVGAAICVVAAAARLGFIASVLSKPVLVGYITGVGLTLLSSQIAGFTGNELSMGMSNDFEVAVEEGSTMVRLGTILLGERVK